MLTDFKKQLQSHLNDSLKNSLSSEQDIPPIELEIPADKDHGDFSSNIALKTTKLFNKPPLTLAQEYLPIIEKSLAGSVFADLIVKVEIKKPGFINFFLTPKALFSTLEEVFKEKDDYGKSDHGKAKKILLEFVSANPTGPLSVAHARQAAVGDALGNILNALGFKVTKEFYVNDEGNQINLLGESIRCRASEILGEKKEIPEGGYQGEYIKTIAQQLLDQEKISTLEVLINKDISIFIDFGIVYLMKVIKTELSEFHVEFDVWSHQTEVASEKKVVAMVDDLKKKDFLYEKDGALWFKSTQYGDDKDRVVKKSDGTFTYLAPDIVYHKDKYTRGFSQVVNIWGPDHHGYIARLKAAVEALGQDRDSLKVLIVQLATIYRSGKPVSMSTRKGEYISLREVIDEVGVDAARFFFLMRHIKVHLDFDLELAKKETAENPVYYIQYAYARINSINRKAEESKLKPKTSGFSLLKEEPELDLIKKLGNFSETLVFCADQYDPFPLVNYMQELATIFHRFYDIHRVIEADKDLSRERLGLVNATKIVLEDGLKLLGLSTPERM